MEESLRLHAPMEELGEEGFEYEPSEDAGDISLQLGEKIRSQAQRLAALEQYRMLCEQRLLELAPNHPIPVLPEHLGTASDSRDTELYQALQKISRLEQELSHKQLTVPLSEFHSFPTPNTHLNPGQLHELYAALYSKAQHLIREKMDLEESLRLETLQTEEQRAYIEALKQALETKTEQYGRKTDLFPDLPQSKHEKTQLTSNLPEKNQELQSQLSLKTREIAEISEKNREISKELEEVTSALQQSVDELSKLESEKTALLEYIQEHAEIEKSLFESKQSLENMLETEKNAHFRTQNNLKNAEKTQKNELEMELNQIYAKLQNSENRGNSLEAEINELKEKEKLITQKNENLQAINSTLANSLRELQTEIDNFKENCANLTTEKENLMEINGNLEEKIADLEENLRISEGKIEELNRENDGKSLKKEINLREIANFKEQIKELEFELNQAKNEANLYKIECETIKNSLENSEKELKTVKKTKEKLEMKSIEFQESQNKSTQSEIKRLNQIISSEKRKNDDFEEEIASLKSQIGELEGEIRAKSSQLRERDRKLSETLQANEALKSNLDSLQADLDKISADTQVITEEANRARQLEQRANQTMLQHNTELQSLRRTVSQCANVISVFSSNFCAVTPTASYSSVTSTSFKEVLLKWSEWTDGDLSNTMEHLVDWVKITAEEVEALVRRVSEQKETLEEIQSQQIQYETRIRDLDSAERLIRGKESDLTRELDSLLEINQSLKRETDLAYQRIETLTSDNVKSRREVQSLTDELTRLKDQIAIYSVENMKKMSTSSDLEQENSKDLEEKIGILLKEKKELEVLLARFQTAVPSNPLQRVFLDMIKTRGELESLQRDKLQLESTLLTKESEMRVQMRTGDRIQAAEIRKEVENLRLQLNNCESQIGMLGRKMMQFESDLQEMEKVEKRRFALQEENEQNVALLQEQLFLKTKELAQVKSGRDTVIEEPASQTLESRLSRMSIRENRPRMTLQDKLSQAKAELSELRRRPVV